MTRLAPDWLHWPQTQRLIAAFAGGTEALRFVGGAVRDALLSRPVQDVDAATPLPPEAVMARLREARITAIPTGIAHGTVTAAVDGKHFEITTLRRDTACDGRHAEVAFTDDWRTDAARRDFTMNALYLTPAGTLFDYFGGEADARAGRVRFIGDAAERIAEDRLRILRFFRMHAHYGAGPPDAAAVAACTRDAAAMARLSGERVQAELLKLLAASGMSATLARMQREGILAAALGMAVEVSLFAGLEAAESEAGMGLPPELKLAGFVWTRPEQLVALGARLRLPHKTQSALRLLLRHAADLPPSLPPAGQKKLLRQMGAELFTALALLCRAETADGAYAAMLRLAAEWQPPVFPVSGEDLIAQGIAPGRGMGERLRALEEAWEESDYRLDKPALLALLNAHRP